MNFENLWKAVVIFQCYPFRMCRGLRYSYTLKRKLDGSYGDELFFLAKGKKYHTFDSGKDLPDGDENGQESLRAKKTLGVFGASIYTRYFCSLG